jgi:hypothetical protein
VAKSKDKNKMTARRQKTGERERDCHGASARIKKMMTLLWRERVSARRIF